MSFALHQAQWERWEQRQRSEGLRAVSSGTCAGFASRLYAYTLEALQSFLAGSTLIPCSKQRSSYNKKQVILLSTTAFNVHQIKVRSIDFPGCLLWKRTRKHVYGMPVPSAFPCEAWYAWRQFCIIRKSHPNQTVAP
eukprot:1145586-Pelagomonas_calceolata.AAC.4